MQRTVLPIAFLLALASAHPAGGEEKPVPPGRSPPVIEKTVYVPYEKLQAVYEKEGRGIFLPYEEFLKLWTAAQPKPPDPPPDVPPAPVVIRGGTYTGLVRGSVATLSASFEIEALRKGWSELPLPFRDVAIESAEVSKPRALFSAKEGSYALFLPEAGRYTLSLQLSARVAQDPGRKSVFFGIPPTAASRLDLTIPEDDVRVEVKPVLAVTQTQVKDRSTRVLAFLGNSSEVSVSWMPPPGKIVEAGALLSAEQSLRIHLGERILTVSTEISYQVLRGEVDALHVRPPAGMKLISVKGENIREWVEEGGVLLVRLHSPLRDGTRTAAATSSATYKLSLTFENALQETPASLTVPFPRVDGVIRESGWAVLGYESGLRVSIRARTGLSQLDRDEVPEPLRPGLGVGLRYLAHPVSLELAVEKITPSVRAEVASVVTLGREEDIWTGAIQYTIAKAGLFRLEFRVPARWNVASVGEPNVVEDFQTRDEGGARTVTVSLKTKAQGTFRLPFRLTAPGSAAEGEATLSPPAVLGVEGVRGLFGVSTPKAFDLTTLGRENMTSADLNELFRAGILGQIAPDAALPLCYSYRQEPASVRLRLVARKTEIDLLAQHLVEIADGGIKVTHLLDFEVLYAAADRLLVSAPTSLDGVLKIEAKEKKEVRRLAAEGGRTTWEILLQAPALGGVPVTLTHELDLKGLEPGKPFAYAVPIVHGSGVRAEKGAVAVRKEGTLEVVPQATNLEAIDAGELPDKLRRGQIYSAFRYFAPDPALSLTLTRYDHQTLATTVVNLLRMRSILTEEQKLKTSLVLFLQNTERQYLELFLPREAKITTIAVSGKAQPPRRRKDSLATLIQIPPSAGLAGTFPVVIDYEEALALSSLGAAGLVRLETPKVLEDIPVSKVELELYLPPGYVFFGRGGSLRPASAGSPGLWGRFQGFLREKSATAAAPGAETTAAAGEPVKIELPTRGYFLKEFETLAPVGTLRLCYADRTLFSLMALLAFLVWLGVGILFVKKGFPALCAVLLFLCLPLLGAWFTTGAIEELCLSLFAGGVVLSFYMTVPPLLSRVRAWRAARTSRAPDPFIEDLPAAPWQGEAPPPKEEA